MIQKLFMGNNNFNPVKHISLIQKVYIFHILNKPVKKWHMDYSQII